MSLKYEIEITILPVYSGGCRNTYFETKRSGGNDEQNKLIKVTIKTALRRLQLAPFIASIHSVGLNIPVKSIKNDCLAFLVYSSEEWIGSSSINCMSV